MMALMIEVARLTAVKKYWRSSWIRYVIRCAEWDRQASTNMPHMLWILIVWNTQMTSKGMILENWTIVVPCSSLPSGKDAWWWTSVRTSATWHTRKQHFPTETNPLQTFFKPKLSATSCFHHCSAWYVIKMFLHIMHVYTHTHLVPHLLTLCQEM